MQQRKKIKIARLEIVAEMYKRGNTIRKICEEVKRRLQLPKDVSTTTIQRDIETLLVEWRDNRIADMDLAMQLELERIDDTVRELWAQWEKSKLDYTKTENKRKGAPQRARATPGQPTPPEEIKTILTEENRTQVVRLGDVSYIAEIRQQLTERRKLLGMYAAEKREITGKDGKPLNPEAKPIDISQFTSEEKALILKIARQDDK